MDNKIQELFQRYESGEANDKECKLVEEWFAKYDKAPVELNANDKQILHQLDNDIDDFLGKIKTVKDGDRPVRKLYFPSYAAIWAGLLLMSAVILWQIKKAVKQDKPSYVQKINTNGVPIQYLLPDSSKVYLGAGSKLQYPENFKGDVREIKLQGVAFFSVKHNAAKPFIIYTNDIQTQVLGTSFKVDAFDGQPIIVSVATGKVSVSEHHDKHNKQLAMLSPGRKVTWISGTQQAIQGKVDVYSLEQWQLGNLVFEEQSLGQVAAELQGRFGIHITFMDKELANYKVSSTFSPNETVGDVLRILSTIGKFRYVTDDNKYFKIYKKE